MLTLDDSADEAAFRAEVKAWTAALPAELRGAATFEDLRAVDHRLGAAGLLGISWPTAYGGREAPPSHEAVLTEELGAVGIRRAVIPSHQGVNSLGPALIVHGSESQKEHHLPAILAGREVWCQGFSEPDAGSDLANVRTTARQDGDRFIVTGSKVWTSGAQHADWIFLLVRNGAPAERHRGLSFLLAPMNSPGITMRPIHQITGEAEFCEVFFDEVAVDAGGLVGEVGDGWRVAMTVLSAERLSGRFRYATFRRDGIDFAARVAAHSAATNVETSEATLRDIGRAMADIEGMGALALRVDSLRSAGKDDRALPSVNKLWWPAAHQRFLDLELRVTTDLGLDPSSSYLRWLDARSESIYGGAAQIQRNIIAERVLGMPRSPR
jgi:alkylation response protein AidB-like acyl-CoA dehydrogenase